jgi:hypothetical protein
MHKLAVALTLLVAACSASPTPDFTGPRPPPAPADGGGPGDSPGDSFGDAGSGSGGADGCSDAARLVYVLDDQAGLYSFAPDKLAFDRIGTLDCPSGQATPNSMAVDRSGTAWVNYSDGSLFKVSTKDASCEATAYQPGQSGISRFGMAFASNAPGSKDETLFVCGIDGLASGQGLAKIDLGTLTLSTIGDFSGNLEGQGAELTGNGAGKLFGFFTTFPDATLAAIAPSNAATTDHRPLEGVTTGFAWAFSFWGGDFWFYTSLGFTPSSVTRLKASGDGSIEVVKEDVGGFRIVGAGVSTCAPTEPPR